MEMNRSDMIKHLKKSAEHLDRFSETKLASELIHFRPSLEDAWTIHEHLVHILDAEVILFLRIRRAIAEPGIKIPNLGPFVRGEWTTPLEYSNQSIENTVEAFKRIRSITYSHLKSIADRNWDGYYLINAKGNKTTLDEILKILSNHVDFHIDFIKRNEHLWQEQKSASSE